MVYHAVPGRNAMAETKNSVSAVLAYSITVAVVLLAGLTIYRDCVFGPYDCVFDYIGSDSVRQLYPSYWWLFETLFEDAPSFWSLNMGLGTSVFSHSEIVFNPLTYILYIGGKENIGHMFVWLIIAGMCLSSISLNAWLGSFGLHWLSRVVAAASYAVSGWVVVMGSNVPWITAYVYFPLLLKALDMFVIERKRLPLVLIACATAAFSFYFLWMFAVAGVVYAVIRMHWSKGISVSRVVEGVLIFIFGALLSAAWLLPSIDAVLQGSRLGTDFDLASLVTPDFSALLTAISRVLGIDVLGSASNYSGSSDFFNLTTYATFVSIATIPQLWALSNLKLRRRIASVGLLCALSVLFPVVAWVFNGFSDFSYRWLFVWSPIVSLATGMGLDLVLTKKRWSWKATACVCSLFALASVATLPVFLPVGDDSVFGRAKRVTFALLVVVSYALLLSGLIFTRKQTGSHARRGSLAACHFAKAALLSFAALLFVIEMGVAYRNWPDSRSYSEQFSNMVENGTGFFDSDLETVRGIRLADDSFYRIEKDHGSVVVDWGVPYESDNDSMVQNYFGTHSYNSMNASGAIDFLRAAGVFVAFPAADLSLCESPYDVSGPNLNYINGVGNRYKLMALLGVKYYITIGGAPDLPDYFAFDEDLSSESRSVWRNKGSYPFASFFESAISESDYRMMSYEEKDDALLSSVVLEDNAALLSELQQAGEGDLSDRDVVDSAIKQNDIVKIEMLTEGDYVVDLDASNRGVLLVATPYEKDNWSILVDGEPAEAVCVDCGLLGVAVNSGEHVIRVRYLPRWFGMGAVVSCVSLIGLLLYGLRCRFFCGSGCP